MDSDYLFPCERLWNQVQIILRENNGNLESLQQNGLANEIYEYLLNDKNKYFRNKDRSSSSSILSKDKKVTTIHKPFCFIEEDEEEDMPLDLCERLCEIAELFSIKSIDFDPYYKVCKNELVQLDMGIKGEEKMWKMIVTKYLQCVKCTMKLCKTLLEYCELFDNKKYCSCYSIFESSVNSSISNIMKKGNPEYQFIVDDLMTILFYSHYCSALNEIIDSRSQNYVKGMVRIYTEFPDNGLFEKLSLLLSVGIYPDTILSNKYKGENQSVSSYGVFTYLSGLCEVNAYNKENWTQALKTDQRPLLDQIIEYISFVFETTQYTSEIARLVNHFITFTIKQQHKIEKELIKPLLTIYELIIPHLSLSTSEPQKKKELAFILEYLSKCMPFCSKECSFYDTFLNILSFLVKCSSADLIYTFIIEYATESFSFKTLYASLQDSPAKSEVSFFSVLLSKLNLISSDEIIRSKSVVTAFSKLTNKIQFYKANSLLLSASSIYRSQLLFTLFPSYTIDFKIICNDPFENETPLDYLISILEAIQFETKEYSFINIDDLINQLDKIVRNIESKLLSKTRSFQIFILLLKIYQKRQETIPLYFMNTDWSLFLDEQFRFISLQNPSSTLVVFQDSLCQFASSLLFIHPSLDCHLNNALLPLYLTSHYSKACTSLILQLFSRGDQITPTMSVDLLETFNQLLLQSTFTIHQEEVYSILSSYCQFMPFFPDLASIQSHYFQCFQFSLQSGWKKLFFCLLQGLVILLKHHASCWNSFFLSFISLNAFSSPWWIDSDYQSIIQSFIIQLLVNLSIIPQQATTTVSNFLSSYLHMMENQTVPWNWDLLLLFLRKKCKHWDSLLHQSLKQVLSMDQPSTSCLYYLLYLRNQQYIAIIIPVVNHLSQWLSHVTTEQSILLYSLLASLATLIDMTMLSSILPSLYQTLSSIDHPAYESAYQLFLLLLPSFHQTLIPSFLPLLPTFLSLLHSIPLTILHPTQASQHSLTLIQYTCNALVYFWNDTKDTDDMKLIRDCFCSADFLVPFLRNENVNIIELEDYPMIQPSIYTSNETDSLLSLLYSIITMILQMKYDDDDFLKEMEIRIFHIITILAPLFIDNEMKYLNLSVMNFKILYQYIIFALKVNQVKTISLIVGKDQLEYLYTSFTEVSNHWRNEEQRCQMNNIFKYLQF